MYKALSYNIYILYLYSRLYTFQRLFIYSKSFKILYIFIQGIYIYMIYTRDFRYIQGRRGGGFRHGVRVNIYEYMQGNKQNFIIFSRVKNCY
nr:MAG TPA: hypothetical protein [Caudoviricetes sp.]